MGKQGLRLSMLAAAAAHCCCRVVNEGAKHLSTHTLGAASSQAPEVMKTGVLSKPGDVYAFGMLSEV
jgi:hypothetical protein